MPLITPAQHPLAALIGHDYQKLGAEWLICVKPERLNGSNETKV